MPENFVRLVPELISLIENSSRGWPKRDLFIDYFRKVKRYHGQPERYWKQMREGKPIPEPMAVALCELASEKWKLKLPDPAFIKGAPPPDPGVWADPHTTFSALTGFLTANREMYWESLSEDAGLAARMVMLTLGHKIAAFGDSLEEEACIRRGEVGMGRTIEEYGGWLADIAARPGMSRSLMFFTSGGKKIGAAVVLPLKEESWLQITRGERFDRELTAADIQPMSRHLFIHALSDAEGFPDVAVREKTVAQAWCIMYQAAYFTRRIRPMRPVVTTLASNDYYRATMLKQGYVDTGKTMPITGYPIFFLGSPREFGELTVKRWVPYQLFTLSLKMYQLANYKAWKREDRRDGLIPPQVSN